MSSGVNSLAAVTLEDFIKTFIAPNLSEKKATLYTKLLGITTTVDPVYSERVGAAKSVHLRRVFTINVFNLTIS